MTTSIGWEQETLDTIMIMSLEIGSGNTGKIKRCYSSPEVETRDHGSTRSLSCLLEGNLFESRLFLLGLFFSRGGVTLPHNRFNLPWTYE